MERSGRRRRRRHLQHTPGGRLIYEVLRFAARQVESIYTALGLLIVAGAALAFAGTWAFAELAGEMREGTIQPFDEAVMHWVRDHRVPWLESFLVEITVLGDWIVITVVVGVAALFLSLARRRWSVILLLVATAGGVVITQLLKLGFDRPRPQFFEWGDPVITASFPSGHASSAAVAYGTIAYLVARLHHRRLVRRSILVVATVVIALIAASRIYIGVHYPSDVLAGLLLGLAWAAFCMAALEATQRYLERRANRRRSTDEPLPEGEPRPEPPVPAQHDAPGSRRAEAEG